MRIWNLRQDIALADREGAEVKSLQSLAEARGLRIEERGPGHFQIIGGTCLVNYYPDSKRRSAYIAGQEGRARRNVTPEQAIEMAFEPAPEGWAAKASPVIFEEPAKRSVAEWIAMLPHLRFAWKKQEQK